MTDQSINNRVTQLTVGEYVKYNYGKYIKSGWVIGFINEFILIRDEQDIVRAIQERNIAYDETL